MMVWGGAFLGGLLSWWLTGLLAQVRLAGSMLDHPNERSLHDQPTPRTGGVAILAGVLCGLVVNAWSGLPLNSVADSGLFGWPVFAWILLLTYLIGLVSFLDDRAGLPVLVRFGVHLTAAVILVVGARVGIFSVSLPLVGSAELGWLAVPLSIGCLVWMTNLYNFMDGMDGFSGGMAVVGGAVLAGFGWAAGHGAILLMGSVAAAAAFGFLVHNFPPAKIFMGDVGSVSLGFLFGVLILLGVRDRVFDLWPPLMLFSPFIVDATVTLLRRLVQGERIWQAHRTHYYQRLVLLGWGHRMTVTAEYAVMILCGALAWEYQIADERVRCVVLGCWALLMAAVMVGVHVAERSVACVRRKG